MGGWHTSPVLLRIYRSAVVGRQRWGPLRLFGVAALSLGYVLTSLGQWCLSRLSVALLVAALQLAALAAPRFALAAAIAALVAAATALVLAARVDAEDDSTGHRGGAEGFKDDCCENTVEAVAALLQREREQGPLPHFPYLEFDVQETADGELVVYHDSLLTRGFPRDGINAAAVARLEQETGIAFGLLTVADCRLAQLQALHVGGRPGVCIPTLKQLLDACIAGGVQRSLAIEMKQLLSDAGRLKFLDTIRRAPQPYAIWYLDTQGPRLDRDPRALRQRFGRLGWAGVIAFPHLFARSFGVFGSEQVLAHLTRCLLAG
ncbi:hypothetical protein COHA_006236 [Chlorella ohadii]|uniref:glycerophosphodiester phosphodiesterase n=1 Tax=Chlorella ohadii TaxID=2649997 RepID=A0AAD5DQA5_9CHLO|nr:hypothetical protein COHA_006236 [Chlorella ohadii]